MIFIWGYTNWRRKRGWFADYCSLCREPTAHHLTDVYRIPHFYYLPVWCGTLIGREQQCRVCGDILPLAPESERKTHHDHRLKHLMADVHESKRQAWQGMQQRDVELARQALARDPKIRIKVCVARMVALEDQTRVAVERGPGIDFHVVLVAVAWVVFTITAVKLGPEIANNYQVAEWLDRFDAKPNVIGVILGIGSFLMAIGYVTLTHRRRYINAYVYPRLALTLRPVQPTLDELNEAIGVLKTNRSVLRRLKARKIARMIAKVRVE